MNWVQIIVVGIIVISGIRSYHKGFILSLFSLCALIVTIFLTSQLYPIGSRLVNEYTNLDESIQKTVANTLQIENEISKNASLEEQISFINDLPLPKSMKENLLINNNNEMYDLLQVSKIEDYISGYIAKIAINIITFFIIFVLIYLGLYIGVKALNIISKLPVINSLNKLLGLVFGFILGIIRVWLLFIILTFFSASPKLANVFDMIQESSFVNFLYNNNLLLKIVIDLSKTLF